MQLSSSTVLEMFSSEETAGLYPGGCNATKMNPGCNFCKSGKIDMTSWPEKKFQKWIYLSSNVYCGPKFRSPASVAVSLAEILLK